MIGAAARVLRSGPLVNLLG